VSAKLAKIVRLREELAEQRAEIGRSRRLRGRRYGPTATLVGLAYAMAVLVVTFTPLYLWSHDVVAEATLDWLVPVCMFGSLFGLGIPYFVWQNRVPRGEPPAVEPVLLTGPSTVVLVDRVLTETAREARRVRLEFFAQPRLEYHIAARRSAVGYLDLAIGGAIIVPVAAAAVAQTVSVVHGEEQDDGQLWLLWGIVVVGVIVVTLLRRRRRGRQLTIAASADQLQSQLGQPAPLSPVEAFAWLNRHWPAPTPTDEYFRGPYHSSVSGTVDGFPVMVDLEPAGFSDESSTFPPRAVVYVAAVPGARTAGEGEATAFRAAIGRSGFVVTTVPGAGLVAHGRPETIAWLRADPSRLTELTVVIWELVTLAVADGAAPPDAG
jgi:hypothetical protein